MPDSTVRTERLLESLTNMHHVFRCLPPTGVINKGEFYVLQHVFQQMDRKGVNYVTPTELSEAMEVTKPAISKMLNVLEDKGYIERQQDSKDRRAVYVTLTEKGQGVREESMKIVREAVNRIIRQMGDQAADRLIDALQDLLLAVRQCYPHDRSPREEQE